MRAKFVFASLLLVATALPGFAQLSPSAKWATEFAAQYTVNANLTYRTASNQQLKMDVYYRRERHHAAADSGVYAWRLLGSGSEGDGNYGAHALA